MGWDIGASQSGGWDIGAAQTAVVSGITGIGSGAFAAVGATGAGTVLGSITGTGTAALPAISGSGSGAVIGVITGTGTLTLAAIDASGAGAVSAVITGSGTSDLPAIVASGSGNVVGVVIGVGSHSLAAIEAIGSGSVHAEINSTGGGVLAAINTSGSGSIHAEIDGVGSSSLAAVSASGSGVVRAEGGIVGTGTLAAISASGTGTITGVIIGTGHGVLAAVSASGSGSIHAEIDSTGTSTLAAISASGVGTVVGEDTVTGIGSAALAPISVLGAGTVLGVITGTGSSALAAVGTAGSGAIVGVIIGAGTVDLRAVSASGRGVSQTTITGTGSVTLAAITASGASISTIFGAGLGTLAAITTTGTGTVYTRAGPTDPEIPMVTPGTVTPAIRFGLEDGTEVTVDDLQAEVYNSSGVLQYTITMGSPGGVETIIEVIDGGSIHYEITDLDVSDHLVFPGAVLTVTWTVLDSPVIFQPSTKFYTFLPTSSLAAAATVITWAPTRELLTFVGYSIYRKYAGSDTWSCLGYSDYPTFVDRTVYAQELLTLSLEYQIRILTQDVSEPTGTELVETEMSDSASISTYRTDQALCLLVGQVVDVVGRPDTDQIVNFFIHDKDAPVTIGITTYKQTAVTVPLTAYGKFAAHLVQGMMATCEIPNAGYVARFVVPTQPYAVLADLTTIPIELLRGE